MKKLNYVFLMVALLIIDSCKNGNITYKILPSVCQSKVVAKSKVANIKNIKIYLETSASMKGYINKPHVNDSGYVIKTIVPYLITDLDSKVATTELYTINSSPTRYKKSKEEFTRSLFNGTLINGGSTYIHKIFKQIINNNNFKTGISFLISDCILDVGNNNGEKDKVGSAIYDLLSRKNISVLLFQYYSEFNGDWYYDRNSSERPFLGRGITMHKRPFYIWVIGSPQNLSSLLKKNILKNYKHSFAYGISLSGYPRIGFVAGSGKGKVYLSKHDFTLIDNTRGDTSSFAIGVDLSKFPGFIQNISYLRDNLVLDDAYLKNEVSFNIYRTRDYINAEVPETDRDKIARGLSPYTHVIEMSLNNISTVSDTAFTISLYEKEPLWIKHATIKDDVHKKAKELEGKTYAFNIITNAFKNRFLTKNNCIFKINFKKIK